MQPTCPHFGCTIASRCISHRFLFDRPGLESSVSVWGCTRPGFVCVGSKWRRPLSGTSIQTRRGTTASRHLRPQNERMTEGKLATKQTVFEVLDSSGADNHVEIRPRWPLGERDASRPSRQLGCGLALHCLRGAASRPSFPKAGVPVRSEANARRVLGALKVRSARARRKPARQARRWHDASAEIGVGVSMSVL